MKKKLMVTVSLCFLLPLVPLFPLWCQTGFDFVNQELSEIVYAVSLTRTVPIICDDTVQGTGNFRFSGGDFDTAFDSFLLANRLYVEKRSDRWIVSRIHLIFNDENNLSLDAFDVFPERLFEELSLRGNQIVLWESLPSVPVTIHTANVTAAEACSQILAQFAGYTAEDCGRSIRISASWNQLDQRYSLAGDATGIVLTPALPDQYTGEFSQTTLNQVLKALKNAASIQFVSLISGNPAVADCSFENRSVDWILDHICRTAGCQWTLENGLYVVTEEKTPEKLFLITLESIQTSDFLERLPSCLNRNQFAAAGNGNLVFFTGTQAQYDQVVSLLPSIDVPEKRVSYDLLIIQTQKNQAQTSGFSSLSSLDGVSFPSSGNTAEHSSVSVQISPGMQCNIDIAGLFGISFARKLQAAITENTAEIYADTTLHGVSGVPISFRNTNTYRYRDPYFSSDTGSRVDTGVTREIVSGLVLDITGTVSGDGSVTTEVTASFSRQGVQDSASKGNPPPTSEKMVTTRVLGKSGEIIVLSGLVQDDASESAVKTPWISKIPIIGRLFSQREETSEKNEMVIYLIPHTDHEEKEK